MVGSLAGTYAQAAPRPACSVLGLDQVRSIVGAPLVKIDKGSFPPRVQKNQTFSNSTYMEMANGHRFARLTLAWSSPADLSKTNQFYMKRHMLASAVHGDVLVLALVGEGDRNNWAASKKLLAAALAKI